MTNNETAVPQELLDILVCPVDKAKVHLRDNKLVCEQCGRAYPVREGIPIMLEEEAVIEGVGGQGLLKATDPRPLTP